MTLGRSANREECNRSLRRFGRSDRLAAKASHFRTACPRRSAVSRRGSAKPIATIREGPRSHGKAELRPGTRRQPGDVMVLASARARLPDFYEHAHFFPLTPPDRRYNMSVIILQRRGEPCE